MDRHSQWIGTHQSGTSLKFQHFNGKSPMVKAFLHGDLINRFLAH